MDAKSKLGHAKSFQQLEEIYIIQDELGHGTFAHVYRAIRRDTNEIYAVKVVNKSQLDTNTKNLLKNELDVLKQVSKHPGIVTLYDEFECEQFIMFVLEYIDGGGLLDRVAKQGKNFSENDAREMMISTLKALEYIAGRGYIHRDIKPENILFDSKSKEWPTRLTDFGLSAQIDKSELLFDACGTPAFCSPEVLRNEAYDCACDMWSFGIVLYIILAGQSPFDRDSIGESIRAIEEDPVQFAGGTWRHISDEAKDIVCRMLEKDRRKRITAAEALRHPWFSRKQSNTSLPNDKLKTWNIRRKFRIRYFTVRSAHLFWSLRDCCTRRGAYDLQREVEKTRKIIEGFEKEDRYHAKKRDSNSTEDILERAALDRVMVGTSSPIASEREEETIEVCSNAKPPPSGSPAVCGLQLTPAIKESIAESGLEEDAQSSKLPPSQPTLRRQSLDQPRLRRRRNSLILPPIDFTSETTAGCGCDTSEQAASANKPRHMHGAKEEEEKDLPSPTTVQATSHEQQEVYGRKEHIPHQADRTDSGQMHSSTTTITPGNDGTSQKERQMFSRSPRRPRLTSLDLSKLNIS